MNIKICFCWTLFLAVLFSCSSNTEELSAKDSNQNPSKEISSDTISSDSAKELPKKRMDINYKLVATADTLEWLQGLTGDSLFIILVLNRVDKDHLFLQDSLVLPDVISEKLDDYCPFPLKVDSIRELNKIIYISRYAQLYALYENGIRIKWGPTSTGKKATPTPKGLMSTNWKSKRKISTVDDSWILNWCFNISNGDGISLHEYALPGYPASHSCVRLYAEDAKWIYYWADQWIMGDDVFVKAFGTPVIIFGDFPLDSSKPWQLLALNSGILDISPKQLYLETKDHYDLIYARQKTRVYILEKKEAKEKELIN